MAAVAFLGERFTVINAVGLCILIAGVVLFNYLKYRKIRAGELAVHSPSARKAPAALSPRRQADAAHLLVRTFDAQRGLPTYPLTAAPKLTVGRSALNLFLTQADPHHIRSLVVKVCVRQQCSPCVPGRQCVCPCCCYTLAQTGRIIISTDVNDRAAQADDSDGECSTPPPGKLSTPVLRNPTSGPSPFAIEAAASGDSPQGSRLIDPSERGHLRPDVS